MIVCVLFWSFCFICVFFIPISLLISGWPRGEGTGCGIPHPAWKGKRFFQFLFPHKKKSIFYPWKIGKIAHFLGNEEGFFQLPFWHEKKTIFYLWKIGKITHFVENGKRFFQFPFPHVGRGIFFFNFPFHMWNGKRLSSYFPFQRPPWLIF